MGNSGPGVLEFKAFALSYNSTLPLYNKHTENKQKKGLNEGFSYSFIIAKESGQNKRNGRGVLVWLVSRINTLVHKIL